MRWPEEEWDEENYPGQYRRAADDFIVGYHAAPWRNAAITSVRRLIESGLEDAKSTGEPPRPPDSEELRAWLDAEDFPDVVDKLLEDDSHHGVSLTGALLAEAVSTIFCNRPSVARWQMIGGIIENDPVARMVLVHRVEHRMSTRPRLRDDIRKVARTLVNEFVTDPAASTNQRDGAMIAEMHRRWVEKPDLQEIWFGLRGNQYVIPFRSDWHIFDLLFEVDTAFAAELIEEYGSPFQPALILSFGALNPRLRFMHWERLVLSALPAFKPDGSWNGQILLPLLLYTAQDAMQSSVAYLGEGDEAGNRDDTQLHELVETVAQTLWERSDGCAAALRWSAWLFRNVMSSLDGERMPYPRDASSRARPAWLTIQTLVRWQGSVKWLDLRPTDVAIQDELCLEAVRILAAQEHDGAIPGRDLFFQMLPNDPEQFLEGDEGKRMRELPSLFTIWGKRADAFGTRVLAAALFGEDMAANFRELWYRTLILREIAEHDHAFRVEEEGYDDRVRRASETIRFVIALGINLIDYLQDERQTVAFEDRRATTLALFATLHDATREMLAIDPIGRRDMESVHDHLCVRRFFYEDTKVGESPVATPLAEMDRPTPGDMLFERSEVSRSFFNCLQMLLANGITGERIKRSLQQVGVDLDDLVEQARRLNSIEHTRTIDLANL